MTGFKDFTSTTLSSADVDGYLMAQAVIVCTSSTRPASPHEGMTIYETDTDRYAVYNAAWIYTISTTSASRIGVQTTGAVNSVLTSSIDSAVLSPIYWNSVSWDPDGMWAGAGTSSLTIQVAGLYIAEFQLTFTTSWTLPALTSTNFLRLVNGSGGVVGHRTVDTGSGTLGATFGPFAVTAGSTIQGYVWQSSGSTKTLSSGALTLHRISA